MSEFKFNDLVEITNPGSFYFKCEAVVESRKLIPKLLEGDSFPSGTEWLYEVKVENRVNCYFKESEMKKYE